MEPTVHKEIVANNYIVMFLSMCYQINYSSKIIVKFGSVKVPSYNKVI